MMKLPIRFRVYSLVLGGVLLLSGQQMMAGGFYLTELGTPGSLGTAGVANSTNTIGPDSAFTNPAGMTGITEDVIINGMQGVFPVIKFDPSIAEAGGDDGGNAGTIAPIPSFFAVKTLSDRARFGIALSAPLGGGVDYGNDFVGRYAVTKAILTGVGLSSSVGYRINDRLSVGGGLSVIYTILDEEIAIRQPGRSDGKIMFDKIDDWGVQGYFGLTYQFAERALLGVVYRTKMDVNLSGKARIRNLALPFTPAADRVEVSWDNPQLLEVGLRYRVSDRLTLFANADWEDWSTFSRNQLAVSGGRIPAAATLDRNWKDTWKVGLALAYQQGDNHLFTMGTSYDSSPVDDDDRTFDLPVDQQIRFSTSFSRQGEGKLSYSLGATLMYGGENKIDQTAQGVRAKGKFDKNWLLFVGGTLRYTF